MSRHPHFGKSPIKWRQRPDMTIAADRDVKHRFKQTNNGNITQDWGRLHRIRSDHAMQEQDEQENQSHNEPNQCYWCMKSLL